MPNAAQIVSLLGRSKLEKLLLLGRGINARSFGWLALYVERGSSQTSEAPHCTCAVSLKIQGDALGTADGLAVGQTDAHMRRLSERVSYVKLRSE